MNLGSAFARTQVESVLKGEGSFSEMLGLYFADSNQHFAQRTLQSHNAPTRTSDLLYKGALKEKSRSEYSGLIKVLEGRTGNRRLPGEPQPRACRRTRSRARSRSSRSRPTRFAARTAQPCLPVEEEHLFYLMSRGIDRVTAQKLVVFGFFGDVLDRIRVPAVRDELSQAIAAKVEGGQRLEVAV